MSQLNLYRVTVTKETSTEAEALVLAPDHKTAEKMAEDAVEFDDDNSAVTLVWCSSKPEAIDDDVLNRANDESVWLILPDGTVCDNSSSGLAAFCSVLTPELLQSMRLAQIETNNGQLQLLTDDDS